jgi:hypothetical protein
MTRIIDTNSRRHLSGKLAAGLAISAFLLLGTALASASAEDRHDDRRGGDHRGDWHDRGGGGYYAAPPVVYGAPSYYAPPPVVYGPAVGIYLPGVSVGIQ